MYLDKKTLWFSPIHKIHQQKITPWFGEKKTPTNLRAPGWHYFPIQLASRPQMGRRVEIDMGFPGVFKTQGSLGKGPRFFWLRRKFALHVGFYGTSTVFNWQFLLETSIKIGVKSHFFKKNINSSTPSKFTFIPKKCRFQKSSSKILFKPLRKGTVSPSSLDPSTGHPWSISNLRASCLKHGDSTASSWECSSRLDSMGRFFQVWNNEKITPPGGCD